MSTYIPVIRKSDEGRRICVVGDVYRFLATGHETGGRYAMWEAIVPPGSGPPLHVHSREEEAFYVIEGEITFQLNDDLIQAPAGTFVNMPIGSLHRFSNQSDKPARMIITIAPAGLEEMFFEVGKPLDACDHPQPPTKAEIDHLVAAALRFGVDIQLPPH
jgi:quercetin dioxygenase-like cupin family protein